MKSLKCLWLLFSILLCSCASHTRFLPLNQTGEKDEVIEKKTYSVYCVLASLGKMGAVESYSKEITVHLPFTSIWYLIRNNVGDVNVISWNHGNDVHVPENLWAKAELSVPNFEETQLKNAKLLPTMNLNIWRQDRVSSIAIGAGNTAQVLGLQFSSRIEDPKLYSTFTCNLKAWQ